MENVLDTRPGWQIASVRPPDGWKECWGALVCPKHKVHMRVDTGEEFDL